MPPLSPRTAANMVSEAESERREREAYQRGRKDAHVMGRSHPWLGVATIVVAIAGAAALSVGASNGTFSLGAPAAVASAAVPGEPVTRGPPD